MKVTVSKEVAEAIEYLRNNIGYNFSDFMKVKTQGGWTTTIESMSLNDVPIETLAKALIDGYEIEMSPEEKVREYYDRCRENARIADNNERYDQAEYLNAQALGTSITLDILGIKIEGIND